MQILPTKLIPVASCVPHERNYNKHSTAQIEDLRESLRQFGQVKPIAVKPLGKQNQIIAGEGLWTAAKLEGWKQLNAVLIPAKWSKAKVLAYLAADNELARRGSPDQAQLDAIVRDVLDAEGDVLARLAAGEQAALDRLREGEGKEETVDPADLIDKAVELQKKWKVKRGDIWEIGKHRLMCGDSTSKEDVERLMDGSRAKIFATDPPYGVGYEYASHNDKDEKAYFKLCGGFMPLALGLKCFGVVTVGHKHNNWWFTKFNPDSFVVWYDKTKQSPHKIAYLCKTELVLTWGKPQSKYSWDILEVQGVRGDGLRELHTCPKPVELFAKLIEPQTKRGDVAMDFFAGSGTTLVACEQTGRIGYGMEIEPKYCAVTLERLSLLGLTPRLIDRNG